MLKEILTCKSSFYAKKVQHEMVELCQKIPGKKRVSPNINITRDNVLVSGSDLADLLVRYFSSISADLPPLDPSILPAFLPAPELLPFVT